jgi:hypothetical protein
VLVLAGSVPPGTPPGTALVASAVVSFDGEDAVAANNRDTDTIRVVAGAPPAPSSPPAPAFDGSGLLPATGAAVGGLLGIAVLLVGAGHGFRWIGSQRPSGGRRR